eukprot:scaffold52542_cov40-Phaeocystis_antarctica.AAC.3
MSPQVGRACGAKRREGEGAAVLRRLRHGGAHSLRRKSPRGPGLRHWAHVEPPPRQPLDLLRGGAAVTQLAPLGRVVQRRCEVHFGVAPRLTDIVFAVHEAAKAFFETALGKVGPAAVRIGNGQGCPRGPDRSLLPLTVVIRAVEILAARGFVYAAPSGFERGVPQFWMADDGAFVGDSVEGVQLIFEDVHVCPVLAQRQGDARRLVGYLPVPRCARGCES